ncbi:MAG: prolipoprotein diacylglyceryl transferase [Anaerolineales bacterium]
MINPIIFSFKLFNFHIALRWYGVLVMFGAVVGAWIAEKEISRRGEKGEVIWDGLVWVLPIGILGARIWYVLNSIIGGSRYYLDDPIKMLYITEGGLHIFGGFLFGAVALYYFIQSQKMDFWLFLDSIAPAALIGQALARPANFINQELYGPPTTLPWGILINNFESRLAQYQDLNLYPLETARFHPTFAYEMVLNILAGLALLWIAREYREKLKPGAIFAGWLISAGLIRTFIEFFRPDQPHLGASFVTTSMLIFFLMAVVGVLALLIRSGKWQPAFAANWEAEYFFAPQEKPARARQSKPAEKQEPSLLEDEEAEEKPVKKAAVKKPAAKKKTAAAKKTRG